MGVRLYPITEDPARLEALCCVPRGTAAKLREISERPEFRKRDEDYRDACQRYERFLDEVFKDEALKTYHGFVSRGWGKLFDESWEALEEWHRKRGTVLDTDAGECRDPETCAKVLAPLFTGGEPFATRYMRSRAYIPSRVSAVVSLILAREVMRLAEGVKWS